MATELDELHPFEVTSDEELALFEAIREAERGEIVRATDLLERLRSASRAGG